MRKSKNNPQKLLKDSTKFWQQNFPYKIMVGAELEFYYHGKKPLEEVSLYLSRYLKKLSLFDKVVKEKGGAQYELVLKPSDDLLLLAAEIEQAKEILASKAVDFAVKPIATDYGSALHISLSLHDEKGTNLFTQLIAEQENLLTLNAVAGLMESLAEYFSCFIPSEESKKRLEKGFDAPTHLAWGGNNRTAMLRLPETGPKRRIEHRLAGIDANPYLVLHAIIRGMAHGILNELLPPPKLYGNAYDPQYGLISLVHLVIAEPL